MKILLYVVKSNRYLYAPPLGAGYIASYLLRAGHQVKIIDNIDFKRLSKNEIDKTIREFRPAIVGFTAYTYSVQSSLTLARWVKEAAPDTVVIFGGPHATYMPHEVLSHGCVDIVVTGEGEIAMSEIAGAVGRNQPLDGIKGILYKDSAGAIINNGPRPLIEDLDSLPFPAYELLNMGKYYPSVPFNNDPGKRFGTIITGRGCPYECIFCANKMFGKKARLRSPENVVSEMELLAGKFGIANFLFVDDAFMIDLKRVTNICELMLQHGLKVSWGCSCRADQASKEIFSLMRSSGCRQVFMGLESGSQQMLDSIKKKMTVEEIAEGVRLAKEYIGRVACGFIFGMPGDTMESIKETIKFARKLNPDYATFSICIPLPGSEVFDRALREGQIKEPAALWGKLNLFPPQFPVINLCSIEQKKLFYMVKKAYLDFYLRPGYLWGRLCKISSARDVKQYVRGAWELLVA